MTQTEPLTGAEFPARSLAVNVANVARDFKTVAVAAATDIEAKAPATPLPTET